MVEIEVFKLENKIEIYTNDVLDKSKFQLIFKNNPSISAIIFVLNKS